MNTTDQASDARRRRRRHGESCKSEAVSACRQPGLSIAAIAMSRGVNAKLPRRWVVEAERIGAPVAERAEKATRAPIENGPGFVDSAALL